MKINKNIAISESGAVFDSALGNTFSLNETGLFLLERLRNKENHKNIINLLINEYEVQEEQAEADVTDFFLLLRQYNIISD